MKGHWLRRTVAVATLASGSLWAETAAAEDKPKLGWSDSAELSYVLTSGNAESSSLGFRNTLKRTWERSLLTINAGGIRVESTTKIEVGSSTGGGGVRNPSEKEISQTTAENYFLNGRLDHKITERFFWYVGAAWDRNRISGIDNRYVGIGGVGNVWIDADATKWKTDYAATWTKQKNVVTDPSFKESFAGLRVSSDFLQKIGANAVFTDKLIVDENLSETQDYRADWTNALSVSISKVFALKASLQVLYDHDPSIGKRNVFDFQGISYGSVDVPLKTTDTIFTTSLVANF